MSGNAYSLSNVTHGPIFWAQKIWAKTKPHGVDPDECVAPRAGENLFDQNSEEKQLKYVQNP